jgi:hypothetical protein
MFLTELRGTTSMTCLSQKWFGPCQGVAALTLILLVAATGSAQSSNPFGDFSMKITEKEMNLEHPTDMKWQKYIMWDVPFQRMNDRNMPYIELKNDSNSDAPITEFHLTIGDTKFNFSDKVLGAFAKVGSTTKGFQLTSSTVGGLGDELVVKIGNGGLQPGALLRFKIDLDVDEDYKGQFFAHPDYRTVLFDMNGLNIYDGNLQEISDVDNALATAIFEPTEGDNFSEESVLHDELVVGPAADFYNDNYRRYRDMDPVRAFQASSQVGEIPEPASMLLLVCGMAGGLTLSTRSRRSRKVA